MSLNKKEIRVLKLINDNVSGANRTSAVRYLIDELGFPNQIAVKVSTLWFLNYREDGKYEEIEEVNRDTNPILTFLNRMEEEPEEFDQSDIPDKFYGKMQACKKTYQSYGRSSVNTPCIEIDTDGVTFYLGDDISSYTDITGVYEDDYWRYSESFSNYGGDYYDEYDDEEFNYLNFNDETIELMKKIAIITKNNESLKFLESDGTPESEALAIHLEKMLPENTFNSLRSDYLYTISVITSNERTKALRDYYNDEIKYEIDNIDSSVTIPFDDFKEIIENNSPLDFDEVADLEFQPSIDLENVWFDAGYWNSDSNEYVEELNKNLEGWVEDNDEGQYDEWLEGKLIIDDIIKKTKLEKKYNDLYMSKDGRLDFYYNKDIDFTNKKIKFRYDNESHVVPFENFADWAQGSVLDLKNESVRYGRVLIMEEKQTINKISIFDFDGTLADTPNKEDGIALWEAKNKKDYPHKGWWGKPESLDENTFNVKLIPSTIGDYNKESEGDNTLMIMLTGRIPKLANQVESILNKNGVIFDEYRYKEKGDTFSSKINTIKRLLEQNPNVTEIEMWEDRLNHADGFEEWGNTNDIDIKVNRVII